MRVNNESPYLHKKEKPWRAGLITLQGHVHTNPDISEIAYFILIHVAAALKSGFKSGIPLTIEIQIPSSTDKYWNPVPGIRNPQCGIQNPGLSWIPLKGGEMRFRCPESPVSRGKNWLICGNIVCSLKFIRIRVDIALSYDPYFCFGCLRVEVLMLHWWSSPILWCYAGMNARPNSELDFGYWTI